MVKKYLIHAILIVHESTREIYKQHVQASLDGWDVTKKHQVHLSHKTWQNLTDTDTCENIRLIEPCIYYGYYKIFSKGQEIMAIHHNLLLQGFVVLQCDDPEWCLVDEFLQTVLFHPVIHLAMKNYCFYNPLINLWSNTLHWHCTWISYSYLFI